MCFESKHMLVGSMKLDIQLSKISCCPQGAGLDNGHHHGAPRWALQYDFALCTVMQSSSTHMLCTTTHARSLQRTVSGLNQKTWDQTYTFAQKNRPILCSVAGCFGKGPQSQLLLTLSRAVKKDHCFLASKLAFSAYSMHGYESSAREQVHITKFMVARFSAAERRTPLFCRSLPKSENQQSKWHAARSN